VEPSWNRGNRCSSSLSVELDYLDKREEERKVLFDESS
jgi:hypothetical protein